MIPPQVRQLLEQRAQGSLKDSFPLLVILVAVVQKDTQYCMRLNLCFRDDILLFVTPIAECMYFLAQKDVVIVVLRMALRP